MAGYIALFISILCLIILSIILIRFKKLFSTDNLVSKTKTYMDRMVTDMNRNAMQDIGLINENSEKLKKLLLETDNTVKEFNEATDRLRSMLNETENVKAEKYTSSELFSVPVTHHYENNKNVSALKTVSQRNKELLSQKYKVNSSSSFTNKEEIDPDATVSLNDSAKIQGSLFDDITLVTNQGAAYKEVPLIQTKILDEKPATGNFINVKNNSKSLSEKVNELLALSFPVDEIAKKLNCSITEVQNIIDLGI